MQFETTHEILARHKREVKQLDGERRAALKKAKAHKGKKAKDETIATEEDYNIKEIELRKKHDLEIADVQQNVSDSIVALSLAEENTLDGVAKNEPNRDEGEDDKLKKKREKARVKREKSRQENNERDAAIAAETAAAGPSPRVVEMNQLTKQLAPHRLVIREVEADGHCLYRAVAAQCRWLQLSLPGDEDDNETSITYQRIRHLCANTLRSNAETYGPFCEFDDSKGIVDFDSYVQSVANSADWGGHLELRLLSKALYRTIYVYRSQSKEPLVVKESEADIPRSEALDPIRLSYHLHYYALGEHYNHVVQQGI